MNIVHTFQICILKSPPKLWNSLAQNIRIIDFLPVLKSKLIIFNSFYIDLHCLVVLSVKRLDRDYKLNPYYFV